MTSEDKGQNAELRRAQPRWIGAPLISGDWFDLEPDEASAILAIVRDYLPSVELPSFLAAANVQRMRAMPIEVYPEWLLAECQARLNPETVVLFAFLLGPTGVILLDGKSDAIHAFNQLMALDIASPTAAAEYLTFFCTAVRSDLGRFEIISSMSDLTFAPETTRGQKSALRRQLTTLTQEAGDEPGIRFQATVRYGPNLFKARFRVPPNGRVEMLDDEPLDTDVTLEVETFEGPFRIPPGRSR